MKYKLPLKSDSTHEWDGTSLKWQTQLKCLVPLHSVCLYSGTGQPLSQEWMQMLVNYFNLDCLLQLGLIKTHKFWMRQAETW